MTSAAIGDTLGPVTVAGTVASVAGSGTSRGIVGLATSGGRVAGAGIGRSTFGVPSFFFFQLRHKTCYFEVVQDQFHFFTHCIISFYLIYLPFRRAKINSHRDDSVEDGFFQ